jgi:hypothetical protein
MECASGYEFRAVQRATATAFSGKNALIPHPLLAFMKQ